MPVTQNASLRGTFPIAPTPFTESGELDLDSQKRVLDCMIDQGVDAICILANYSEQFLLSDDERDTLMDLCLKHVAGRVPVIVTCSHFSTRIAAARGKKAAAAGAAMLMFGDLAWVRRAALAVLVVLLVAATIVQFRERCPRCGLRLGSHGRLFLPEQCRGCGVAFAPPPV